MLCVSELNNYTLKNMSTCGKTNYTGTASVCRNIKNCEIPLNTSARNVPCTCKSGFSMR